MRRRGVRTILAAVTAVFALAGAATAETLADALISAYKTSNIIEQNRAVLRAADEDVASAVAALRPALSFIANGDYSDPVSPGTNNLSGSIALSAQMTLYDSGRNRIAVDIAKETVLATREALVGVEQNILQNAVEAYFGVRSATENVSINQNSVRVLGENLRATQDQFDVGEVTRTDVALSEARLAGARAALAAAEGQLAAARELYKAVTGHYPGPLAVAPKTPPLPRSVAEARAIAQRSHPSILQAQHLVAASDLGVTYAAAQRLPSLTGSASVARSDSGQDVSRLGINLTQPIYAGGKLSSVHRKAIAQRDQARAGLHQAAVLIDQGVGSAWAQIEVTRAQISASAREVEAAQIAYDGVREEAKLGARTTLDVLDAEQSLLDARASRITAEADYQTATYSLLATMGLLTAEHLNLGVPVYDPAGYYNAVKSAPVTSVRGKSLDRVLEAIGRN
ncbi:MAG: TolC family outer membrane protein [Defluviimonas sp.]|uniref:TolC family outer membrane protein n=1 Tax=Albidovulum sp. TaxID=1872424 RepID=UPI001D7DA960|nr:TolC family outer membrane protein [Paracoccaceae bacterium]MCC0064526.1 TolC family outer membrane protein [Defluviimonas sp.]